MQIAFRYQIISLRNPSSPYKDLVEIVHRWPRFVFASLRNSVSSSLCIIHINELINCN